MSWMAFDQLINTFLVRLVKLNVAVDELTLKAYIVCKIKQHNSMDWTIEQDDRDHMYIQNFQMPTTGKYQLTTC